MIDNASYILFEKDHAILPLDSLGIFQGLVPESCFALSFNFVRNTLVAIDEVYKNPCLDSFLSVYHVFCPREVHHDKLEGLLRESLSSGHILNEAHQADRFDPGFFKNF